MSSTNKTTNYELSQYIGSDKPTYLTDYNGDMYKIDAQMKINADNVATAITGATNAGNLASTANSTATTANTNANTAIANNATTQAQLNAFMQKFNLTTFLDYDNNNVSFTSGDITITGVSLHIARNTDGSIFKCYGFVNGTPSGTGTLAITMNNTGIPVDEPYYINPVGVLEWDTTKPYRSAWLYVENNKITLYSYVESTSNNRLYAPACVYFNGNFGDTPQE